MVSMDVLAFVVFIVIVVVTALVFPWIGHMQESRLDDDGQE